MLRKIRIAAASISFILVTLLFLDFTGTLEQWFGWMANIQFLPALLAINAGILIFIILLTLLFGRVYCSVICPLGVFQDLIGRMAKRGKKLPYSFTPARSWLRYSVLVLFILCLIAGFAPMVTLLDPYSAYGRIANNLFTPVVQWGNNLIAFFAFHVNSYFFSRSDVWLKSLPTFVIAIVTLITVIVLVWQNGRTYCNTICPVGTVLGFLSEFSLFRMVINPDKCNKCGVCAHNCKSACINNEEFSIDHSRCVACMNCTGKCKKDAISYRLAPLKKKSDSLVTDKVSAVTVNEANDRRGFLTLTAMLMASTLVKAQEKTVDGGLAVILGKKIPNRSTPILPPGSRDENHMKKHCTACQLCVTACPNQVLRPSDKLMTFMQPEMSFERGYCRPECIKCSEVCPTDAIQKITKAEKSSIRIGHVVWVKDNCVVLKDKVSCNNCERHCPTKAIQMVPSDPDVKDSLNIPVVNQERCIGCGACETLCPARPFSALYVDGNERHLFI